MFIYSPLDQFEVSNLIGFTAPILGNFNLNLTNLGLYTIIVLIIIVGLHYLSNNNISLIPSSYSIAFESSFASLNSMVRTQIGPNNEVYLPFIYSLFFFVLISNLVGNVPYSFAVTSSIITSLGLSFVIFLGVTFIAVVKHKIKFFAFFVPNGTPLPLVPILVVIELISYLSRSLSLGLRLFANISAGHTLLAILSSFLFKLFNSSLLVAIITIIPFILFMAIIGLEIAVSLIQAYVFSILVCTYIKDAVYLH